MDAILHALYKCTRDRVISLSCYNRFVYESFTVTVKRDSAQNTKGKTSGKK